MNLFPTQGHERTATGEITLFGHTSTRATVTLIERSRGWRLTRSLGVFTLCLLVAPLVALIPPHAPWAVVVLVTGGTLARRRWLEHHALQCLEGECPRCGAELALKLPTRLKNPHPIPCDHCLHEPLMILNLNHAHQKTPRPPLSR